MTSARGSAALPPLGFVQRHWREPLRGTDYLRPGEPLPHVEWLKTLDVAPEVRAAIGSGNARAVLGMKKEG
ncbi:MAG: hypothetical protein PVH68_05005 [Armatimonadota bacterium]|jgi:hypothetical protein